MLNSFQNFKRMVIKIFGNMKTLVPKQDSPNPPGSPICMERTTLVFIIQYLGTLGNPNYINQEQI